MRIALYQPDIPQNTGNIFRIAACFGVHIDIIEPVGYIFNDKRFKRSSMDYLQYVNYKRHIDWDNFYKWTIENNYNLILLTTKSNKKYYEYKFRKNDVLLFGRESAGVPEKVHKCVHERLKIPMIKGLRSINVSSAVSLVVGEALKQLNLF
tara:strand:- start:322 stop:774 length:453 start_codon:yes stop_codon:yes gene_type:complete